MEKEKYYQQLYCLQAYFGEKETTDNEGKYGSNYRRREAGKSAE
jgi:hypothetical protein